MRAPDPRNDAIRALLASSGNRCAFFKCDHKVVNRKHQFIAEVCHIEAASEGGQRWRRGMTDAERRSFDNLLILCHEHHVETNDVKVWTVQKLKDMKARHEARFAGRRAAQAVREEVVIAQAKKAFEEQWSVAREVEHLRHRHSKQQQSLHRRAEHVQSQLKHLYGPFSFFVECNAHCHEHAASIFQSMVEASQNGADVDGAVEAWDAVNSVINENNQAALHVLCSGWSWIELDDREQFACFAVEVLRYRLEIIERRRIPIALLTTNLSNPVRPGMFFRPEFVEHVRHRIAALYAELSRLQSDGAEEDSESSVPT